MYMRLPFVSETICRRVKGIIKGPKLNIRMAWQSGPTLESRLVKSALEPLRVEENRAVMLVRTGSLGNVI